MVSAILLAAGKSTRMGRLKALLPWGKGSLLETQIEQVARSGIEEIVVVLGFQYPLLEQIIETMRYNIHIGLRVVHNHQYETGKASSIRLGMEYVSNESKGVFILGVDQPVLTKTLGHLLNGLEEGKIYVPVYQGKRGHPPLFSFTFYEELKQVSEQKQGLRDVMQKNPDDVQFIDVDEPHVLLNLNNEQDYLDAKNKGLDILL